MINTTNSKFELTKEFKTQLSKIKDIEYQINYSLKNLSYIKIGGKANYYIKCNSLKSLKTILKLCIKFNIKYKIIGNGSNLLFDDLGFNGAIIKYNNNLIRKKQKFIICSSSIKMCDLLNFSYLNNLSGLENFTGIPCCLGGAVKNNLGAYGKEISHTIISVKYLSLIKINNKIKLKIYNKKIKNDDFSYRKCNFLNKNDVILKIKILLTNSEKINIFNKMQLFLSKKANSQPLNYPSCGSTFKRNDSFLPAKAIDELGLKGFRIGDAQISNKHAGFIVNLRNATSKEVLALIDIIKLNVFKTYNQILETEIEYIPY